jgi:predicted RecB family nuclease
MTISDRKLKSLYDKFSDGRTPSDMKDLRSSRMFSLIEDEFGTWCDFHAPREELVMEKNVYAKVRTISDYKNKESWAQTHYPDLVVIDAPSDEQSFRETLQYMANGASAIQNPYLWDLPNHEYGKANLIVKDTSHKSVFGKYHYRIIQFKQALEVKEHYAMQTALLNRILGKIQKYEPEKAIINLRHKSAEIIQKECGPKLERIIRLWNTLKDQNEPPDPGRPPHAALPPWRVFANKYAYQKKHIMLIPAITPETRNILKENGLTDLDLIEQAGLSRLSRLLEPPIDLNVFGNAVAYNHNVPVLKPNAKYDIKRAKRKLYFDFENSDDIHPKESPHTYLIGVWESGKYTGFLANGSKEEEKIFSDFLDYIGDTSKVVLYHWTNHEVHDLKKAAKNYPKLEERIRKVIAQCVDIMKEIQKVYFLPSPSFSLKSVAPSMGFNWRQDDCDAMSAMTYYWDWLSGNKEIIKKVLIYNEDDCYAMAHIDQFLQKTKPLKLTDMV